MRVNVQKYCKYNSQGHKIYSKNTYKYITVLVNQITVDQGYSN